MVHFLIWTALWLPGVDEAAQKTPLAEQAARLVAQLDAAELGAREEAERKLLALGPDVLPCLPAVGARTPAEIALRVTRVQQKLLEDRAQSAARPTTVTLSGKNLPLEEVLAALTAQTKNNVVDHREAFGEEKTSIKVNAEFADTPFWQALDDVLDQSRLTLYGYTGQRGAFVVNRNDGNGPRVGKARYAGLFRLEPLRFEAVRDLRNDGAASLKFFLEATWEPRLQPFAIMQPLGEISVVGDSGEVLSVTGGMAEPEASIREGMAAVELEIPLSLPGRGTKSIRTLRGKLMALVPGTLEEFRFKNLPIAARNVPAQPVDQRQAGTTVTVEQVRKNNDAWEVAVRVKFDAPSIALESHRSWILDNEALFVDAGGKQFTPGGFEQTRQTRDDVGITYFFVLDEPPNKLEFVYRTPITILEIPVAYEFRDLPLP